MIKKEKIINNSVDVSCNSSGIYFLIDKGIIVYVGESGNATTRVYTHKKNRLIEFSSYYILLLKGSSKAERLAIEIKYIELYNPKYNRKDNPKFTLPFLYNKEEPHLKNLMRKKFRHYRCAAEFFSCSIGTISNVVNGYDGVSNEKRSMITKYLIDKK